MLKLSWKTTVGGILGSVGTALSASTGTAHLIGVILSALGMLVLGTSARDNGVTSEQAGLK